MSEYKFPDAVIEFINWFKDIMYEGLQDGAYSEFTQKLHDADMAIYKTFGYLHEYTKVFMRTPIREVGFNIRPLLEKMELFETEKRLLLSTAARAIQTYYVTRREEITQDISEYMRFIRPLSLCNDIFIVHGHDGEMKQHVARIITQLGLDPLILHEQTDRGDTIIEKLERHSNVQFAIVCLSADDVGCLKPDSFESLNIDSLNTRARQNVILELGYFYGKITRRKVVALYRRDPKFEFPSDFLGILYIPYDPEEAWKYRIVEELQRVGYDVSTDDL